MKVLLIACLLFASALAQTGNFTHFARKSRDRPPQFEIPTKTSNFTRQVFEKKAEEYANLNRTEKLLLYLNDNDIAWSEDPKAWHQQMARVVDHQYSSFEGLKSAAEAAKKAGVSVLMLVGAHKIDACPGGWYGGLQLCDDINGDYPIRDASLREWQQFVQDIKPMKLMWWANFDYWSVQGPVWKKAQNSGSEENSWFSWGATRADECWGSNPNGAQGSWGSDGGWSGWQSALASWGKQTYVDYLVDALANSWVKNLEVEGFTVDCICCYDRGDYNCNNGMMNVPDGSAQTAFGKIVQQVQAKMPNAVFSGEDYFSWEDVIRSKSNIAGQGWNDFHTDLQGKVYNADLSGAEGTLANSGADAITLLCYLHPSYDGVQPGGCPTYYFRDKTTTMTSVNQFRMWAALEAGSGILSQHDAEESKGIWWGVQMDPATRDDGESPLSAFMEHRALNRLGLRTQIPVTSGRGAYAMLKHDSMGPDGDAAILIFNPAGAQSVTLDLSMLPSNIIDGSVKPKNLLPPQPSGGGGVCFKELSGGIPKDEGNDVGSSTGGALGDCKASCSSNAACNSFTFGTAYGSNQCFLKDKELTPNTPTTNNPGYQSWYITKCQSGDYAFTAGYCRGGAPWPSGDVWNCVGTMSESACAKQCDSNSECGAYDRPTSDGDAECCLFKSGSSGNGEAGRQCMVKYVSSTEVEENIPALKSSYTIQMGAVDMKFLAGFKLGSFAPRQGKKNACQPRDGFMDKKYNMNLQSCFLECLKNSKCQNVFIDYVDIGYYGAPPQITCTLLGEISDPSTDCYPGQGTLVKKLENGRRRR